LFFFCNAILNPGERKLLFQWLGELENQPAFCERAEIGKPGVVVGASKDSVAMIQWEEGKKRRLFNRIKNPRLPMLA
jgi:hypothetical protein